MTHDHLSRRELVRAGGLMSAGLALSPFAAIAAAPAKAGLAAITKPIPKTGERLPVIGLGTNQYSVQTPEEMAALQQVLAEMTKLGGSVVDTARMYGRSEEVLGDLFQKMGNRQRFFISTKTPGGGELRAPEVELQASFDRLKVSKIDLMLIHNLHGLDHLMPAFIEARKKGTIRYIGMSTSVDDQYAAQMEGMRKYPLDFIQVDYSLGNRGAAEAIIPLAQQRKMAVLVNMPFGGRRGASSVFAKVKDRKLPDWAAKIDATSWAQVFLKYIVSHPGVTVAIPGTTKVAHVIDNQGGGRGRLPNAAMRREMERYWDAL